MADSDTDTDTTDTDTTTYSDYCTGHQDELVDGVRYQMGGFVLGDAVSPSENLDLYCLMDGSKSMSTSKEELASVTSKLVADLEKLSNNMRLGFGMFVDKPVLPYTDMLDKVRNTNSSTNVDRPEGTLDALMQVVSCENKVGWRRKSLKVVVVFTDAGFHVAGDGKMVGSKGPGVGSFPATGCAGLRIGVVARWWNSDVALSSASEMMGSKQLVVVVDYLPLVALDSTSMLWTNSGGSGQLRPVDGGRREKWATKQ
ncbi:Integrin beta-PS [Portunus trituberculatus]|uniref:Integrin beta n=1 Tax=Portunus trituberculatus TaxID=210409 RepID=A0A5B7CMU6_PORTR|nr:Integrin beta-PS [Portunus trituberculatus]